MDGYRYLGNGGENNLNRLSIKKRLFFFLNQLKKNRKVGNFGEVGSGWGILEL